MNVDLIKISQRNAAKIAGITYPLSIILVIAVNLAIVAPIIIKGNLPETARNIMSNELSFRIGITGNILYSVLMVVLLVVLYSILKYVNKNLALFAALCRLISSLTWLLIAFNQYTVLRLLSDADLSHAFGQEELYGMMKLHLSGQDAYYIGLLFWALASTTGSYLWFKSGYIPKILSITGVVSSAWCVLCTLIFYISPKFADVVNLWWFDSPMVLFELTLSFWLLFKGLKLSGEINA